MTKMLNIFQSNRKAASEPRVEWKNGHRSIAVDSRTYTLPLTVDIKTIKDAAENREGAQHINEIHAYRWDSDPTIQERLGKLKKAVHSLKEEVRSERAILRRLKKALFEDEWANRQIEEESRRTITQKKATTSSGSRLWTGAQITFYLAFSFALLAMAMNTVSQVMIDSGVSVAFILNPWAARLVSLVPVGLAVAIKLGYSMFGSWRTKRAYFGGTVACSVLFGIAWIAAYAVVYASHLNEGIEAVISLDETAASAQGWLNWGSALAICQILAECFTSGAAWIRCDQLLANDTPSDLQERLTLLNSQIKEKANLITEKRQEVEAKEKRLEEKRTKIVELKTELNDYKAMRQAYLGLAQEKLTEIIKAQEKVHQLNSQAREAEAVLDHAKAG